MKLMFKMFKNNPLRALLFIGVYALLFLYIFAIPTFGENTGALRYLIYISLALLALFSVLYNFLYGRLYFPKLSLLIPFFSVFGFIGTAIYSKQFRGWFSLVLLTISFFVLLLSFTILKSKYRVVSIISFALFCFNILFIIYNKNSFLDINSLVNAKLRLGQPFDNPNGISAFAVVALSTSFYMVLFYPKNIRFIFIVPFITACIVGYSTGSRSFFIMAVIFIIVLLFFRLKKHKLVFFITLGCFVGVCVLLINLPFMSFLKERLIVAFQTIFGTAEKVDTSTLSRENFIAYGTFLGSKNALFGYGFEGFGTISGLKTYSHSNYAEVLCNFGIIGLGLFYAPLIILFFKSITDKRVDKSFVIPFVLYYLIISMTNVLYYKKIYFLVLAFMFYVVFYLPRFEFKKSLSENKNICFAVDSLGSGGAERVVSSLSNEFIKRGYCVSILVVSSISHEQFYNIDQNVKIHYINNSEKKCHAFLRLLLIRKYIKKTNPYCVISFLKHICIYLWLASYCLDFKHVVSERNDPNSYSKFYKFILKRVFYSADFCVFQTNQAIEWYGEEIAKKSTVIYNPVNLNYYPKSFDFVRNKTLISVGRLEEQKNFLFLIEVFEEFYKKHSDYILKIYGEGKERGNLEKLINDKNLNKCIHLLGNSKNWHEQEYNAGCFILTSLHEGMPNALEEAACLHIPCVSSNCKIGGPFELSKVLSNIVLVEKYNVNDYVEAIEQSISKTNIDLDYSELKVSNIADKWLSIL